MPSSNPVYFASPAAFGAWLATHHATAPELLVGYHKKHTSRPSMTWAESVDEALCYGWIDGVRRSVDDDRYTIRFTPRKSTSTWSAINITRVGELAAEGRMQPAGLAAFERRCADRSGIYSHENRPQSLEPDEERTFRKRPAAWSFFEAQPPGYRRTATWLIVSAKRPETRAKRLASLIDYSARGQRIPQLVRPSKAAE